MSESEGEGQGGRENGGEVPPDEPGVSASKKGENKLATQKKMEEQQQSQKAKDEQAAAKEQEKQTTDARALLVRGIVAALGLALVLVLLLDWKAFRYSGNPTGTLDAQLRGNPVVIAARVEGLITRVGIDDDAVVRKGQLLYEIEQDTYRSQADAARALVEQAAASASMLRAQIAEQEAAVQTANAMIVASQAAEYRSGRELARQAALLGTAGELRRAFEQATADDRRDRDQVQANVELSRQQQGRIGVLRAELASAEAMLEQRRASLANAGITLGHTQVLAPEDGVVTERLAYLGQYISAGRPLIGFVSLRDVWAVAYYREEQLTFMQPGQRAAVHVDAFPQYEITGRVDSIAPVAQARETTLPPDRATGNFTKVVQRIPVKIALDPSWLDPDPPPGGPPSLFRRLIPGLSVEVHVFTTPAGNGAGAGGGTGAGTIVPGASGPQMPPPHTAPAVTAQAPMLPEAAPAPLRPIDRPAIPATPGQPGRPAP